MSTVYLETTIVGYLASRPSRDLITAANQQITRDWWDAHSQRYELFVSETVVAECSAGDVQAAQDRLTLISGIPALGVTDSAEALAHQLVAQVPLPEKARVDALHVALATVNGIDYLLTWNCTHIANATLQDSITAVCLAAGYVSPTICTPQQLMEE